jgi:hypothetical protein
METFPQQENKESMLIKREDVVKSIDSLQSDEPSKELLIKWIDQNQEEIRNIEDKKEELRATIVFEIDLARLYMESHNPEHAWNSLTGLDSDVDDVQNYSAYGEGIRTMAQSLGHEDLVKEIDEMISYLEKVILNPNDTSHLK